MLSAVHGGAPDAAGTSTGWVHEHALQALKQHRSLDACDFYVCGPPAMLAATCAMLKQLGVEDQRVAFDEFKI